VAKAARRVIIIVIRNSAFISIQYQYEAVLKLILKTILILNRLLNIESRLRIYGALIL